MFTLLLLACSEESETNLPSTSTADLAAIQARLDTLEADLASTRASLASAEASLAATEASLAVTDASLAAAEASLAELAATPPLTYTDDDAVAAVQNGDPFTDPDRANLRNLWSMSEYGYQWLDSSRWTMDNRSDPAGALPRHELVQMFHETTPCTETSSFADCNSTSALKMYVNGPSIEDNDWSAAGYAAQAVKRHHTHASGLYLVSFGQLAYPTDYPSGIIAPSGMHLEPWGAHQAIRIDGSQNSGENMRIDTTLGSTGIAIYESSVASPHCSVVRTDCEESYPLYLRGGTVHLEDLEFARSATDGRGTGPETVHTQSLGVEHFYAWHDDPVSGLPVHCTWNDRVTDTSLIRLSAYGTSPDLRVAHHYVVVEVWGPGAAPANCTGTQLIKTDAAGVYGYLYAASTLASGGFSVALLGPDEDPLYPGDWGEVDRPSFMYEVVEPL